MYVLVVRTIDGYNFENIVSLGDGIALDSEIPGSWSDENDLAQL